MEGRRSAPPIYLIVTPCRRGIFWANILLQKPAQKSTKSNCACRIVAVGVSPTLDKNCLGGLQLFPAEDGGTFFEANKVCKRRVSIQKSRFRGEQLQHLLWIVSYIEWRSKIRYELKQILLCFSSQHLFFCPPWKIYTFSGGGSSAIEQIRDF